MTDPAIKLQRLEERLCDCGAVGSGFAHTEWCKAVKFDRLSKNVSAEQALKRLSAKPL